MASVKTLHCTAKPQYQKFETNIPRKELCGLSPNFHTHASVSDLYPHERFAYSATGKYVDRSWEYINRSQTHECGNGTEAAQFPEKGIHKWDFRCSVKEKKEQC